MKEYFCPSDCPDRSAVPNCHMTCERHLNYQKKKEEMNEARRKESMKHRPIQRHYLAKANIKPKER